MGTETDIAEKIIDKGADYCLSLKKNQPDLYEDIEFYAKNEFYTANKIELEQNKQYYSTIDNSHGRYEKREYFISNDVSWIEYAYKWKGLSGFGVCVSTVELPNGKITVSHN